MESPICHIVASGPDDGNLIHVSEGDMLIAADGGYIKCIESGLEPDLFVGDMDSLPSGVSDFITCKCIKLPREKDDTDTMSACKVAMIEGYDEIRIYNALGGDVGHEIANIQLLAYLDCKDVHCILYGKGQEIHFVSAKSSPVRFDVDPNTRISVFSFGESAQGVFERGLYWELENAVLLNSEPIGVSNVVYEEGFEVGVEQGALLVVIGPSF